MKKITLLFLLAASSITFSFIGTTPEFEGKIVYSISMDNSKMPAEAKSMMAGSTATIYIKGTKARTDISMGPQTTTSIFDSKTNISVTLMDIMGNKYKIVTDTKTKKETDKKPEVKINYINETKKIAGYTCKKAEITIIQQGESTITNAYYTEEIANHMSSDDKFTGFQSLKGMPLEYEIKAKNGMSMKMTATSINKESVAANKFDIPGDYKETTVEEMQKEMMQMMQQH